MVTIKIRSVMDTMQNIENSQNNITESSSASIEKFGNKPTSRELKAQRINELLDSCKDEVLKQIIGPFGLNKAMFNDKDGGNVTTLHNFEQGVVANQDDKKKYDDWQNSIKIFDRSPYDKDLPSKRKEMFKNNEPIKSAYTGNNLSRDGQTHLDHVRAAENIERNPASNLFQTQDERVKMANHKDNLVPCEASINQSMGKEDKKSWANKERKKDPGKTNTESFGIDENLLQERTEQADRRIKTETAKAQIKKQGSELLQTGISEAWRNALRQAMGLVLHELVNSSYLEVKRIAKDPNLKENFVDNIILAMKNTINKIINKSEHIFKSIISGGIQGVISNLLTFIINNIITTSKKIGSIIREGLKGLWEAIKLIVNPPKGMSGIEIARQATKLIAAVITSSLGLLLEKSIEGLIVSVPIFVPLAPIISPVVTAFLTGIMTALVTFGVDRFFDWLNGTGTERLNNQIEHMEASAGLFEQMAQMMDSQFNNSKQYKLCVAQYEQMENTLSSAQYNLSSTVAILENTIQDRASTIQMAHSHINKFEFIDEEDIDNALNNILNLNKV